MRKMTLVIVAVAVLSVFGAVIAKNAFSPESTNEKWVIVEQNYQELQQLQSEVDQGHKVDRLSPEGAALDFATNSLGLKDLSLLGIRKSDNGYVTVALSTSKGEIQIRVNQPLKSDFGIWAVKEYRWK